MHIVNALVIRRSDRESSPKYPRHVVGASVGTRE
jgi:hypothetical protein